jgi:hypothetical protein
VTRVLARQYSGDDPVISVSQYDKSRRVDDMSQTQALATTESAIVRQCVRVDVALQKA